MHIRARDSMLAGMETDSDIAPGLLIAAPCSASGKSLVTLCLLAAWARRGLTLASVKVGPDYIDAEFHRAAGAGVCVNLDAWGMRRQVIRQLAASAGRDANLLIAEGVMGLFDGARDGSGTTADIAALTGWPVILVVDGRGCGHSIGALVQGFAKFRADVPVRGVILNRVASPLHRRLLEGGCRQAGVEVLGALPEDERLCVPQRHLGLVQAREHRDLEALLRHGAALAEAHIDLGRLLELARPMSVAAAGDGALPVPFLPPAQHVAVARDVAFSFAYPHWFDVWRADGREISFFSPLQDEAPGSEAEFVFLPGGYPQLHGGRIAAAERFLGGLRAAAQRGAIVYGECGGYLALGRGLEDADGTRHEFAGLLPLESRFGKKRVLGYRRARLLANGFLGAGGAEFRGHEFHFVEQLPASGTPPALFQLAPPQRAGEKAQEGVAGGMVAGNVMGSFVHLIDRCH